jgi:electron transport complex protein RnfC
MYWFSRAKNFGKTQEYHIFDCIECGCCSFVCPSHIPLVQYFRFAKSEIWAREREKNAADPPKTASSSRTPPGTREGRRPKSSAKAAARRPRRPPRLLPQPRGDTRRQARPAVPTRATPLRHRRRCREGAKLATIRPPWNAKAQREAAQPKNTEQLTPEQQRAADEIEARRVAAKLVEPAPANPANEKAE